MNNKNKLSYTLNKISQLLKLSKKKKRTMIIGLFIDNIHPDYRTYYFKLLIPQYTPLQ